MQILLDIALLSIFLEVCASDNTAIENIELDELNLPPNNNDDLIYDAIDECNDNLIRDENVECSSIDGDDVLTNIDLLSDGFLFNNKDGSRKKTVIKLKCGECQKMILANKQWILLNHINSE